MKKRFILSLLLGLFFLYIAFKDVSLSEVIGEIKKIEWIFLVPTFLLGILTHFFRATRWKVILKGIKDVGLWKLFGMNSVGFLFVLAFPFRLGEIVKPYLLKKQEGIFISTGAATVAVERVFDGITLVLFLVISFLFASFKTQEVPYVKQDISYLIYAGVAIFGLAFLFLFLLIYNERLASRIISRLVFVLPDRYRQRAADIPAKFVQGLSSLPSLSQNINIFLQTVMIWVTSAAMMYLVFLAFGLKLPREASFFVLGLVSLGIMIPAAPGFVGTFQLFCQGGLALYGVAPAIGLSYSIILHAVNILYVVVLGLLFLPGNMVSLKSIRESSKEDAGVNAGTS